MIQVSQQCYFTVNIIIFNFEILDSKFSCAKIKVVDGNINMKSIRTLTMLRNLISNLVTISNILFPLRNK